MNVEALYGLRLTTPRLELRLGSHEELVELAHVAERGIHPRDEMPFGVAWTDAIGEPGFVDGFVEFHEQALRTWSPERWTLNLLVWSEGRLAGTQALDGERFSERRTVTSGSWLGQEHQGNGIGTEMRAAVLELAFTGLGAVAAETGAIVGNHASRRVSEKVGYLPAGEGVLQPRGQPLAEWRFRLERGDWAGGTAQIDGLEPCLPLFGI